MYWFQGIIHKVAISVIQSYFLKGYSFPLYNLFFAVLQEL